MDAEAGWMHVNVRRSTLSATSLPRDPLPPRMTSCLFPFGQRIFPEEDNSGAGLPPCGSVWTILDKWDRSSLRRSLCSRVMKTKHGATGTVIIFLVCVSFLMKQAWLTRALANQHV